MQIPSSAGIVRLCLNDHFTRVDDSAAARHVIFNYDAAPLADARWHDVTLKWSDAQRDGELQIEIDGQPSGRIKAHRPAQFGVNTLRVESDPTGGDGRILITNLGSRIR